MSDLINRIYGDFDKKNEFPKVKLNLPKFDFSHLTESVRNMNSAFENMTKDIRERQDNAMAMEFTKCIGELLRKNGVVPKITEYTRNFETDNTFETRYGVSIDELDFSEHDKVFEDKIAELENIINHKLGDWDKHGITYQEILDMKAENQELKQITKGYEDKIAELEKEVVNYKQAFEDKCKDYDFTSELLNKFGAENESLKQRIAELENRKTENFDEAPDSITIDGYKCKIIKTESGLYISRDEIYSIIDKEKEPLKQQCKELEDRHQSDCIEINRLNTTIDVLIHKVEYLRRLAGLE